MSGTCPHCRAARPEDAERCPACGEPLTPEAFAFSAWAAVGQPCTPEPPNG